MARANQGAGTFLRVTPVPSGARKISPVAPTMRGPCTRKDPFMKDVNTLRRLLATTAAHFGLPRPAGSALPSAAEPPAGYNGRRKSATPVAAPASSLSSLAACGPAGAGSRSPICWRHMA